MKKINFKKIFPWLFVVFLILITSITSITAATSKQVMGPTSATTTNAVIRWTDTSGWKSTNSLMILDDSGNMSGIITLTMNGTTNGSISYWDSVGTHFFRIVAADTITTNINWISPTAPNNGFYYLTLSGGTNLTPSFILSSGTGVVLLQTSPIMVTPTLGDATASSVDITNSAKFQNATASKLAIFSSLKHLTNSTLAEADLVTHTRREVSVADATSITPNVDTTDVMTQANTQALGTLTINNPSGTPTASQIFYIRLKSTNIQTFSWGTQYRSSLDGPLPTASTGSSKIDYMGFMWHSVDSKWELLAKNFGF